MAGLNPVFFKVHWLPLPGPDSDLADFALANAGPFQQDGVGFCNCASGPAFELLRNCASGPAFELLRNCASGLAFELLRNCASGLAFELLRNCASGLAFELLRNCASGLAFELLRNSAWVGGWVGGGAEPRRATDAAQVPSGLWWGLMRPGAPELTRFLCGASLRVLWEAVARHRADGGGGIWGWPATMGGALMQTLGMPAAGQRVGGGLGGL